MLPLLEWVKSAYLYARACIYISYEVQTLYTLRAACRYQFTLLRVREHCGMFYPTSRLSKQEAEFAEEKAQQRLSESYSTLRQTEVDATRHISPSLYTSLHLQHRHLSLRPPRVWVR